MTRGAKAHAVARRLVVGELAQLIQPLVQLAQPGLHELLPLERRLVLGVLPQVAELDRLRDGLRQQDVELMAELVDLPAQLLPHLADHDANQTKENRPGEGRRQALDERRWLKIPPGRRRGRCEAGTSMRSSRLAVGRRRCRAVHLARR